MTLPPGAGVSPGEPRTNVASAFASAGTTRPAETAPGGHFFTSARERRQLFRAAQRMGVDVADEVMRRRLYRELRFGAAGKMTAGR